MLTNLAAAVAVVCLMQSQQPKQESDNKASLTSQAPNQTPSPTVVKHTDPATDSPHQKATPEANQLPCFFGDLMRLDANWVIAGLTLVLGWLAYSQMAVSRDAHLATKAIERAYVTMSHHPPGLTTDGFILQSANGPQVEIFKIVC